MCVVAIVDTNVLPLLAGGRRNNDSLLLRWIRRRHGILAFPGAGDYLGELKRSQKVMELLGRYEQGGQLKKISQKALSEAHDLVCDRPFRSDDSDVLALALASDATVLCSNDEKLRGDFQNREILPKMGRRSRLLYPFAGTRKQRREFLNRQRCPRRQLR